MDVRLILRVLTRFKVLVLAGLVLALGLALLSYVRVDIGDGFRVEYRSKEQWSSSTRLLVTTPGFRLGSLDSSTTDVEARLPSLATVYSSFVTSDAVRRIMLEKGRIKGAVDAVALPAGGNSSAVLPIVNITAVSFTPRSTLELGNRAAAALQQYIDLRQEASGVPKGERIQLRVLNRAGALQLIQPRSKTLPVVVFLAVMFATVALAFVLENANPSVRPLPKPIGIEQQRRKTS
jgi:hypothetical protein